MPLSLVTTELSLPLPAHEFTKFSQALRWSMRGPKHTIHSYEPASLKVPAKHMEYKIHLRPKMYW